MVVIILQPLSIRNYEERLSALLHAEEVQMELEMREFDLQQVGGCGVLRFLIILYLGTDLLVWVWGGGGKCRVPIFLSNPF